MSRLLTEQDLVRAAYALYKYEVPDGNQESFGGPTPINGTSLSTYYLNRVKVVATALRLDWLISESMPEIFDGNIG